ncbi:MAG: hypothetical protein ACI8PQ_001843 [Planctomycetota bacterium]|jgi:hypothetical protein
MEQADDDDRNEGAKSLRDREALARLLGGLSATRSELRSSGSKSASKHQAVPPTPVAETPEAAVAAKAPEAITSAAGSALVGEVFGERFEVLREYGTRGAQGVRLVVADRAQDGREVLLELLDGSGNSADSGIEQQLAELTERLRAFPRESIYAFYASGCTADGHLYLVSDLPQGETLAALHARTGRLTSPHALEIVHQILGVLAHGHRRRLPHGGLNDSTVILDHHALGSGANPHGVAVRLTEFGLDDLLSAKRCEAATVREDIRAAGTILADLIWEPAVTNGRANTEGDNSIVKIIERTRSDEDGSGFRDADEMRRAIEALPGWRAQLSAERKDRGWLVAAGAIAALALSLYYQFGPNAAQAETQTDTQTETQTSDVSGLLIQPKLDRSQAVPREALEKSEGLRAQAQEQLDLLTVRLGQLERDNVDLHIARDALTAERNSLRAQLEDAEPGVNGHGDDRSTRVEQLEAQVAELQSAIDAGLQREDVLLSSRDSLLVQLEEMNTSSSSDDASLGDPGNDSAESAHLLGAALEAPLALGPADVAELASSASDDELMRALAAFSAAVKSLVLEQGELETDATGLNRARLEAIPALAAWTQIAAALGSERELQQIDLARRYFDRSKPMGIPAEGDMKLLLGEGELNPQTLEQLGDWRAGLALSMALEQFPGAITSPPGARALWLLRSANGQVFWQFMESVPRSELSTGETRAWTTTEVRYDLEGAQLAERSYGLRQLGRRFEVNEAGQINLLVDLAQDEIQWRRYAPAPELDGTIDLMPEALGIALESVQTYRAGLGDRAALLRLDGDRQRWFIPGLGLVRFSSPGQLECELVYLDYPE